MKKAYMIIDLQFGSTGKGLLAGYLAETRKPDTVVTAWAPNAGHTYINAKGDTWVHRMLANGIVSPRLKTVLIGAGSCLDLDVLMNEIKVSKHLLVGKEIVIHPHAAVVMPHHLEEEKKNVKIGSTMKGTGAAVVQRIGRDPDNMNVAKTSIPNEWLDEVAQMGIYVEVSSKSYQRAIENAELLQIEGAQGFSLSIYHGLYPYCTSRDVTPSQVMADCCIPFGTDVEVIGTLRTFPIRVANRFNEAGEMIGTSGGGYSDQKELSWEDVGVEAETTTVTKLPRRIFNFSFEQLRDALFQCSPDSLFLNFANYLEFDDCQDLIQRINDQAKSMGLPSRVQYVGVGATYTDVLSTVGYVYRESKK